MSLGDTVLAQRYDRFRRWLLLTDMSSRTVTLTA